MGLFERKKAQEASTSLPATSAPSSAAGKTPATEQPPEVVSPGLPEDDPRQMFHKNQTVADSMTWYATADNPEPVLAYVLSLLDLSPDDLEYAEEGFAQSAEGSLLLIGLRGPTTSSVTVWSMEGGDQLLNAVLEREWTVMSDQLSRGERRGHPADNVRILHGRVHEDHGYKAADVCSFINAGGVVPLRS